jgi:hypothetical protein
LSVFYVLILNDPLTIFLAAPFVNVSFWGNISYATVKNICQISTGIVARGDDAESRRELDPNKSNN